MPRKRKETTRRSVCAPDHPNSNNRGWVGEHVYKASMALGKAIPIGAVVHHHDKNIHNNNPSNLVICQDNIYHRLLHKRMNAYYGKPKDSYAEIPRMKLNIQKIDIELARIGKTWPWIAKELKTSWQRVRYWKMTGSLSGAEPIAELFGVDPTNGRHNICPCR